MSNEFYRLTVNGNQHEVRDAWAGESLMYVLRERLGLPGTKGACEQGECGSCTVLMDGEAICSCLVMAATADDAQIVTVEGLSSDPTHTTPTDVQQAFLDAGGVQHVIHQAADFVIGQLLVSSLGEHGGVGDAVDGRAIQGVQSCRTYLCGAQPGNTDEGSQRKAMQGD